MGQVKHSRGAGVLLVEGGNLGLGELARATNALVRVVGFRLDTTGGDDGRHGLVHKATVAA